ncbi:PREDICTED: probable serine/threonine-protein kinase DDB_G0271682 [Amphimedon queenslandica]|uniref:Protein kinase domain-containing protein n=1 Tax=Amphimedon queenslandica TaxID=400682 RepID=A0A1X7VA67_AMPQE|nr:PREDICTED: probable serine/threonine-protein kinase DDB_G0271682 [Amphimedon queenslandica]|eukprot:XP_019850040.1 PREDICTED: probable serine/threonine-protein kinase DDB_G0271682 [Amphimedon queenslandica]
MTEPWRRLGARCVTTSDTDPVTEELFRKFQGILNKLTPQNFKKLAEQARELEIDNEERLKGCVDIIFLNVFKGPMFCEAYAQMCRVLSFIKVEIVMRDDDGDDECKKVMKETTFRRELLSLCQREFEKDKRDNKAKEEMLKAIEIAAPGEKEDKEAELKELENVAHRNSLANHRFLGELFKLKMLSESIMHECIVRLLRSECDNEALERFCVLITVTGKKLDHPQAKQRMDRYFERINEIIEKKKIELRTRFMLLDVQDLRKNDWKPRRQPQIPKTIDEIHQEAEIEAARENEMMIKSAKHKKKRSRGTEPASPKEKKQTEAQKLNEELKIIPEQLLTENKELKDAVTHLQQDHKEKDELVSKLLSEIYRLSEQVRKLEDKVTALENNWKISYKDVTLSRHKLGSGGWGEVIIGKFHGQQVAVKRFYESIMNQKNIEYYFQMLNREMATLSQLHHPNLLQFIGAVLDDPSGNPMIITEVMDTSLRSAYEKKELTPDPACRPVILSIMRDVAVGLSYLHCLLDPIIHRDVSSANVLLESKGPGKWKTKISDFGLAKMARSATTKAVGAMVYSAPECLQTVVDFEESKQSPKADVFSYGILLCEVITCRFPEHQIFRVLLDQVRSSGGSGSSLHSLVVSCGTKDPEKRPTMKQIIEQLDHI